MGEIAGLVIGFQTVRQRCEKVTKLQLDDNGSVKDVLEVRRAPNFAKYEGDTTIVLLHLAFERNR